MHMLCIFRAWLFRSVCCLYVFISGVLHQSRDWLVRLPPEGVLKGTSNSPHFKISLSYIGSTCGLTWCMEWAGWSTVGLS